MTPDINIPPEAVEAAARAIGEETYVGNKQTLRDAATAAIRAALAAWPGLNHDSQAWRGYGGEVLILPLTRSHAMSETDKEFVERIKREWDGDNVPCVEDFDQLIALARRGADAADEIERLKAEVSALNHAEVKLLVQVDEQYAEIERLRAALRKIASNNQQRSNCFCGACIQARAARAALKENGDE